MNSITTATSSSEGRLKVGAGKSSKKKAILGGIVKKYKDGMGGPGMPPDMGMGMPPPMPTPPMDPVAAAPEESNKVLPAFVHGDGSTTSGEDGSPMAGPNPDLAQAYQSKPEAGIPDPFSTEAAEMVEEPGEMPPPPGADPTAGLIEPEPNPADALNSMMPPTLPPQGDGQGGPGLNVPGITPPMGMTPAPMLGAAGPINAPSAPSVAPGMTSQPPAVPPTPAPLPGGVAPVTGVKKTHHSPTTKAKKAPKGKTAKKLSILKTAVGGKSTTNAYRPMNLTRRTGF